MSYELVEDFSAGLDVRKNALTAPGGSLTKLRNATINPGGEIEKRKAFIKLGTLTGTFGLAATESTLYAFTRNTDVALPGFPMPTGVPLKYQKLATTYGDTTQFDFDSFDGDIYVACHSVTGVATGDAKKGNPHFYKGVLTEGSGKGYYVRTYQSKIYSVLGKLLYFSAVGDPMLWDTGTGHGFINLSLQDADSEFLTSLEIYYDKLAILSSEAIQIWAVDPDPLQNAYVQLLRGTGTTAPRSTSQYGSGDVLFLDQSGIRSMKARDSSNAASVSDIGSPIDSLITSIVEGRGDVYFDKAIALIEPLIGRFWLVFPNNIYVLSYFPGPKITAWSVYDIPFTIDHAVSCGGRVFLRSGDDLYVYGGLNNHTFDNCGVEVRLPYLSGKKPGHNKLFEAIDMTISGQWEARVSYDFNNPDAEETLGVFTQPTWNAGRAELTGFGSHLSLRFYNADANPASLSNLAIHFRMADEEA